MHLAWRKWVDIMDKGLEADKKRQAIDSIRGYVYQAYQSVLAWIRLRESEILFLEGAEDFDVHRPDGVTTTQVKDTAVSGSITLRSSDAIDAINHYWLHKRNNPEKVVSFRFLRTALPGREKGVDFGKARTGIEYWGLVSRDKTFSLEPLKSFLLSLTLEPSLVSFLQNSDNQSIREELICHVNWDTGRKPIDGLITDIQDRLVIFGSSRGIDSHQSEKVLDALLRRVASLLSFDGDRRLSYSDFVREFDQATMELVSREEAVASRALIGQINHLLAHSPTLFDPSMAPKVLDLPTPLMAGVAPRINLVNDLTDILRRHKVLFLHGSTGLGKTSLAQLLISQFGNHWMWAGFRGYDPRQIANHLKRAVYEAKTHGMLLQVVLDDLDLGSLAQFERELLSLIFSISNQGGSVIVTGPTACPPDLLTKLWLSQDCDQEVPYFNEHDIRDVFIRHDLSDETLLSSWARLIWLFTSGHPQLVHARVRNLQANQYPPPKASDFMQQEDLESVRAHARRRLIDELPSAETRYLAYRLSLINDEFSHQTMMDLAQLRPPVTLPGETFDRLVGPWIEILGENSYRVSPLLRDAGKQILSGIEQKAAHEAIAFGFLKRQSMTPHQFGTALMHAITAKSNGALMRLALGIFQATPEILRAISDVIFWFPSFALNSQQHLSEDPAANCMLRLVQFRSAIYSGQTDIALTIVDRTLECLEQFNDEKMHQLFEMIAYGTLLNTIEVPIPPHHSIKMLSRLMELEEDEECLTLISSDLMEINSINPIFHGLSITQILFTFEGVRVSGIDGLDQILDELQALDKDKRQRLIDAWEKNSEELVCHVMASSCWRDVARGTLKQEQAFATLRKAIDFGKLWPSRRLVRSAFVSISILYNEYYNSTQDALEVLDEAFEYLGSLDLHLINQKAKVLFSQEKYDEAMPLFRQALIGENLGYVERIFAGRNGGIAAARLGDWESSEYFFVMGIAGAEDIDSINVGLKADAAFARWKQFNYVGSLQLYVDVLEGLERIPFDEDLQSRHVHAAVRHCLGWLYTGLLGSSCLGISETSLAEPTPGMCSNPEPHEGLQDLSFVDIPAIWGLLGNIDTRLGTKLGLMQRAEEKNNGKLPLMICMNERTDHYEALLNGKDIPKAVSIFIKMIENNRFSREVAGSQLDLLAPITIPRLPDNYWEDANTKTELLLFLVAIGVLSTSLNPNTPLPVEAWQRDLSLNNITGREVDLFFDCLTGAQQKIHEGILERSASSLYLIRNKKLIPNDLLICHLQLLDVLYFRDFGMYICNYFTDIVVSHWLKISEHQRFALKSPTLYAPILKEKCQDTEHVGFSKIASILKTSIVATGAPIHESWIEFLNEVEQ